MDCGYIEMPSDAKIISCQTQYEAEFDREVICIWAMINTENPGIRKYFYMYGTGHEITKTNLNFIGTCKLNNDSLIIHVFEEINI